MSAAAQAISTSQSAWNLLWLRPFLWDRELDIYTKPTLLKSTAEARPTHLGSRAVQEVRFAARYTRRSQKPQQTIPALATARIISLWHIYRCTGYKQRPPPRAISCPGVIRKKSYPASEAGLELSWKRSIYSLLFPFSIASLKQELSANKSIQGKAYGLFSDLPFDSHCNAYSTCRLKQDPLSATRKLQKIRCESGTFLLHPIDTISISDSNFCLHFQFWVNS